MTDNNNPFSFKKEDVESSSDGVVTSGKMSQFNERTKSAYAESNSKVPSYLQKDYQKKAWAGGKDYSTGSYKTEGFGESEKKSWFAGKSSNEASKVSRASGQNYATGSFQTGSANETGRSVTTGRNAYAHNRAADGWGRSPDILTPQDQRKLTMGQAKSLLGR
ncbi:hypothetical protein V2O64_02450 [Verrucomicrobiaceae bacterium 227]